MPPVRNRDVLRQARAAACPAADRGARFPRCCGRTPVTRPTCHRCSSCPSSRARRSSRSSTVDGDEDETLVGRADAQRRPHDGRAPCARARRARAHRRAVRRTGRGDRPLVPRCSRRWIRRSRPAGRRSPRRCAPRVPLALPVRGRARRLPPREHARGGSSHRGRRRLGDLVGGRSARGCRLVPRERRSGHVPTA